MRLHPAFIAAIVVCCAASGGSFARENTPIPDGPYLGQKPPGLVPEVFAPGIISTGGWEYGVVFAPGLQQVYYLREVNAQTEPMQEFVAIEQEGRQMVRASDRRAPGNANPFD